MKNFKSTLIEIFTSTCLTSPILAQDNLRFSSFEPPVGFITAKVLAPWIEAGSVASKDSAGPQPTIAPNPTTPTNAIAAQAEQILK